MSELDLAKQIAGEIVERNAEPVLRFTLEKGEPGIFESKVGGTPYLPREMAWPVDSKGMGMELLAQVDCSGLAGLPDFPDTGLLQFFIGEDDVSGVNFDDLTDTSGFRVFYHETVDHTVTAEEVEAKRPPKAEGAAEWFPVEQSCRIVLSAPAEQGMNEAAPEFDPLFAEKWNKLRPETPVEGTWEMQMLVPERLRDYNADVQPGWGEPYHQLGGWPYFTQGDPRDGTEYEDLDVLLFQLDTNGNGSNGFLVIWGDCGVGNFFINREALRRRDFSRVCYNWDCC